MQMKNVEHKWTVQDIPSQEGRLLQTSGGPRAEVSVS